jgi:cyanophycinase
VSSRRLLIIGGAAGPGLLGRFVALAGGPAARIVVIATASSEPDLAASSFGEAFAALGAGEVQALSIATRAEANAEQPLLRRATGVFFTGGEQERITAVIGGTRTDSLLHELTRSCTS